jgi:hypothetical protein
MQYDTHNSSKQWIPKIYCSQCEEKLTVKKIKQECNMTHTIAQNSGFPKYIVHRLKKKLTDKRRTKNAI